MIFFLYLIAMCGYILSFRVQLNKNFVTRVTKAMEIKQDVQTSSVIKVHYIYANKLWMATDDMVL